MSEQPTAYNAGVGYPVNQEIDGNLVVTDPSGTGLYGNLTVRQLTAQFTNITVLNPTTIGLTPSADVTGVKDTANLNTAIAALPAGGLVLLAPGAFYTTGITVPAQTQAGQTGGLAVSVQGAGSSTVLYVVGGGTGVSFHRQIGYGVQYGHPADMTTGYLRDFVIDGTNATAGAVGLDVGDGWGYDINLAVVNFSAANCVGANLVKRVFWTEKGRFRLHLINNTVAAVISTVVSDLSQEYNEFDLYIFANNGQQGVECSGGCNLGGVRIWLHGNMSSGTATTQGAFAFTATSANPAVFTAAGTALANGTPVFLTGASLPTGFTATQIYYVVNALGTTFQLSQTRTGAPLASSSTGSGTVTTAFAALSLIGNHAGTYTQLYQSQLWMKVEGNNPGNGDGTIFPAAIIGDPSGGTLIQHVSGQISHSLANANLFGGEFTFRGLTNDAYLAGLAFGPVGSHNTITTAPAVPASNTLQQNYGPDAVMSIAGGTVTSIIINGVATGQTSGAFFVNAGGSFKIVYSVAPTTFAWCPAAYTQY